MALATPVPPLESLPLSAHHPGQGLCPWISSQSHRESQTLAFEPDPDFSSQIYYLQPSIWRSGCPGRDFSMTQHLCLDVLWIHCCHLSLGSTSPSGCAKCFMWTQMFSCLCLLGVWKLPSFDRFQHVVPHPFWHFDYVLFTSSKKSTIGVAEAFQDISPQITILYFEHQPDPPYG